MRDRLLLRLALLLQGAHELASRTLGPPMARALYLAARRQPDYPRECLGWWERRTDEEEALWRPALWWRLEEAAVWWEELNCIPLGLPSKWTCPHECGSGVECISCTRVDWSRFES